MSAHIISKSITTDDTAYQFAVQDLNESFDSLCAVFSELENTDDGDDQELQSLIEMHLDHFDNEVHIVNDYLLAS